MQSGSQRIFYLPIDQAFPYPIPSLSRASLASSLHFGCLCTGAVPVQTALPQLLRDLESDCPISEGSVLVEWLRRVAWLSEVSQVPDAL